MLFTFIFLCHQYLVITYYRAMFPASTNNVPEQEENDLDTGKKRPPAMLTLPCGVCWAPAPDHKHFGGREYMDNIKK